MATPLLLSTIATTPPMSRHHLQHHLPLPTQGDSVATQPPHSSIAIIQAVSLPLSTQVAFAATQHLLLPTVITQVSLSPPTLATLIVTAIIIPTPAEFVATLLPLLLFPILTIPGKSLRPPLRLTLIILPVILIIIITPIPMQAVSAVLETTLLIVTTRVIFWLPIQIHLDISLPPMLVVSAATVVPSPNAITLATYHLLDQIHPAIQVALVAFAA